MNREITFRVNNRAETMQIDDARRYWKSCAIV